ncbi:hypothetical protein B0H11DRAFT_1938770 [Mycena galericulata]|nr:hypothetical protein B0H11DRAFT_1938770 [Mycena galericulata]
MPIGALLSCFILTSRELQAACGASGGNKTAIRMLQIRNYIGSLKRGVPIRPAIFRVVPGVCTALSLARFWQEVPGHARRALGIFFHIRYTHSNIPGLRVGGTYVGKIQIKLTWAYQLQLFPKTLRQIKKNCAFKTFDGLIRITGFGSDVSAKATDKKALKNMTQSSCLSTQGALKSLNEASPRILCPHEEHIPYIGTIGKRRQSRLKVPKPVFRNSYRQPIGSKDKFYQVIIGPTSDRIELAGEAVTAIKKPSHQTKQLAFVSCHIMNHVPLLPAAGPLALQPVPVPNPALPQPGWITLSAALQTLANEMVNMPNSNPMQQIATMNLNMIQLVNGFNQLQGQLLQGLNDVATGLNTLMDNHAEVIDRLDLVPMRAHNAAAPASGVLQYPPNIAVALPLPTTLEQALGLSAPQYLAAINALRAGGAPALQAVTPNASLAVKRQHFLRYMGINVA